MFSILTNFNDILKNCLINTGNSVVLIYPLLASIFFSLFCTKKNDKIIKRFNIFLSFLFFFLYICYFIALNDKSEVVNSISGWNSKIGIEIKTIEITRVYIFILVAIMTIYSLSVEAKNITFFWAFFFSGIGFIMTNDIFNMYVFFELFSISLYNFYLSSKTKQSFYFSFKALIISSFSGILFLLAIFFTYRVCGSLNISVINTKISDLLSEKLMINQIRIIYILMIFSMILKCGIYPISGWIQNTYCEIENRNLSAIASFGSKIILFGIMKTVYQIFSYDIMIKYHYFDTLNKMIQYLAIFGIIIGSIDILRTNKIKEILVKSSIISNSYFLLCIILLNKYSIFSFISGVLVESISKAIIFTIMAKYISKSREKSISFENLKFYIPDNINIVLMIFVFLSISNSPIAIGFLSKWYMLNSILIISDFDKIYIFFSVLFYSLISLFYNWKIIQSIVHESTDIFMKYNGRLALKITNSLIFEYFLIFLLIFFFLSITFFGVFKYGVFNEIKNSLQYYFYWFMIKKHIMLYAKNDKLISFSFFSFLFCSIIGGFFGSLSLAEVDQNKIVYSAFLLRLSSIMIIITFSINYIKTIFSNMELSFFLSKPKSRESIIFDMILSFVLLSLIMVSMATVILFLFNFKKISFLGLSFWFISLFLEVVIFAIISVFFSTFLKSNFISFFLVFSFYIAGRVTGSVLPYLTISSSMINKDISELIFQITAIIAPRLDWSARSAWLIDSFSDYKYLILSLINSTIYIVFFGVLSIHNLRNKEF